MTLLLNKVPIYLPIPKAMASIILCFLFIGCRQLTYVNSNKTGIYSSIYISCVSYDTLYNKTIILDPLEVLKMCKNKNNLNEIDFFLQKGNFGSIDCYRDRILFDSIILNFGNSQTCVDIIHPLDVNSYGTKRTTADQIARKLVYSIITGDTLFRTNNYIGNLDSAIASYCENH